MKFDFPRRCVASGLAIYLSLTSLALAHPIIPGTASLDSTKEDQKVLKGQALMDALNCSACHDLPGYQPVSPLAGPAFAHRLSAKYSATGLAKWIENPHDVKPGSRMPDLFEKTEAAKKDAEALAQYLLSLPAEPKAELFPKGDAGNGRKLYHTVGCIACHAPESDYKPELSMTEADASVIKNPSVPIMLSKMWSEKSLSGYLHKPDTPGMPDFKLSKQEAADIAAHIKGTQPKLTDEPVKLEPEKVARGAELFVSESCINCHDHSSVKPAAKPTPKLKVVPAQVEKGCLADVVEGSSPNFHLSEEQRVAIRAALRVNEPKHQPVRQAMASMSCYACHSRDGIGGAETARKPYFSVNEESALSIGEFGNLPPKLDGVGAKLTSKWMTNVFKGVDGHVARPYMTTRMPVYHHDLVSKLPAMFAKTDKVDPSVKIDTSGLQRHHRGHYGRDLLGIKGVGCVNCHGLKGVPALGAQVIDLTKTVDRLRPEYFKQVLLNPAKMQPGTLMPPLFMNRPKANQEIEQIWTYFKEIDQRRLPDGLLKTGDYELKPAKLGKPIVFRTFIEGVGMQGIAVGFPEGIHVAFDARESRWAIAWRGKFLDALTTWDDRYSKPAKPLSKDLYQFKRVKENEQREFLGYKLDAKGVPTFIYQHKGKTIQDTIRPQDSKTLVRTVVIDGKKTKEEKISW